MSEREDASPTIPTIEVFDSSDEEFYDLTDSPPRETPPPASEKQLQIPQDAEFDQVPTLIGKELPEDSRIKEVLGYFTNKTYMANDPDPRVNASLDACESYIERDYKVMSIDNTNGILSKFYPARIPYLVGEKSGPMGSSDLTISQNDLTELLHKAYRARCRQRFPVPVIMYNGKRICRSATLAGIAEIYGRKTLDVIRPVKEVPQGDGSVEEMLAAEGAAEDASGWQAIVELEKADIALLKQLKVSTIVDLMVEKRKQKFGFSVTSSEKVDKDNKYHANFTLLSMPFPGCEFFKEFHDSNYNPSGLYFDWTQPMCDAELHIPDTPSFADMKIDWDCYKSWDLITMTQNYIKYILRYLQESDSGILIHCISGWDRTPLFISLLRLSLWADGLIHKSLNANQMLFFTLAYDWMLFGHHLTDRLSKNEDILLFCFAALKYLMDDTYSLLPPKTPESSPENMGSPTHEFEEKKTDVFPIPEESEMYSSAVADLEEGPQSLLVDYPETSDEPQSMDFGGVDMELPLSPPSGFGSPIYFVPAPLEFEGSGDVEIGSGDAEIPHDGDSSRSGTELSSDVWQIVSSTGSVHGSSSSSDSDSSSGQICRRTRLSQVRRLFYRCYYQTITEKHVNYTNNNISVLRSILRNLNEIASNIASNVPSTSAAESESTPMEEDVDEEVYTLETDESDSGHE